MLQSNLLRSKISGSRVKPIYAALDEDTLNLADRIVEAFRTHIDKRKRNLTDILKGFEDDDFDYRLVRGLSTLLERRCNFKVDSVIDPSDARKIVFEEASRTQAVTMESRNRVIQVVGDRLDISSDDLERSLYSDVDDELILKDFNQLTSEALIKYYNFSLTQTLLFKSLKMEFSASGNWKNIFRTLKRLGLMYSVESRDDEFVVSIDGPLSIFKMTDKYGTSLAKLLPKIAESESWHIKAEILGRDKKRVYTFEIKSGEVINSMEDVVETDLGRHRLYDSYVEERFARRFNSCSSKWIMKREPEPLPAGKHVLIPDFSFERNGLKVYLEIVGFWTPEYLERKITKLNSIKNVDLLVAVNESLACSKLQKMKGQLIYYAKDVPLKPIIDHLHNLDEDLVERETERFAEKNIRLNGDIVCIDDIAKEHTITIGAVRNALRNRNFRGYRKIGDYYITNIKLSELQVKIKSLGESSFLDAVSIVESEGFVNSHEIIDALGYTIEWKGLDFTKARIKNKMET